MTETALGFGIDIGGSGIKGAVVDMATGELVGSRATVATPQPATPAAVSHAVAHIVASCGWTGPVGIALPSVVTGQIARTAANIDDAWVDLDVHGLFTQALGGAPVSVLNDADAAGIAEVAFGDEAARNGAVIFLTFGTGIGSAFFSDGTLFPNTELGHMRIDGTEAEHFASSAVRHREQLSFTQWAARVDTILHEYARLLNPSAFIVGGGISSVAEQWVPLLTVNVPVLPAALRNNAGIVGAAMAAHGHVAP